MAQPLLLRSAHPGEPMAPQPLSTDLLERLAQELRLRNYAQRTIRTYVSCVRQFARHIRPQIPREAGPEVIRAWLLQLRDAGASRSLVDQHVSALRFLYRELYRREEVELDIPRPRKSRRLPYVPSRAEVVRLAGATGNPGTGWRSCFCTRAACGSGSWLP